MTLITNKENNSHCVKAYYVFFKLHWKARITHSQMREIFSPVVHALVSWGWAKLKAATRSILQVSHMANKVSFVTFLRPQGALNGAVEVEHTGYESVPEGNADTTEDGLTSPNTSPCMN